MQANDSSFVHSLNAAGSSMVQVGNNYNTTHHHHSGISDQDKAKIPAALCATDPRDDKVRIETTNGILLRDSYKWILDNPEFLSWRDNSLHSRLLWIRGDPGKGKTMLMCGIIDELEASRLGNTQRPFSLSYFFCQATNSGLNSYTAVLRGLIYMLITQQPSLLSHLDGKQDYIAAHWNSRVVMEKIFHNILADPGLQEPYFVVDALDECLHELSFFLDMISSTCSRALWIVSSRNRCEIQELLNQQPLKVAISLELNAEPICQAVDHFIGYRIRRLVRMKNLQDNVAQQLHEHLSENSEGTFLWVSLACQRLEKCRAWEMEKELMQFPLGLANLYKRMLAQICSGSSSDLYIRLLATVSTVFRPLTFPELVAMEGLDLDEKMLPDVIDECGSFITTKENTVFFIHQSAKDFLINDSGPVLFRSGLAQHHVTLFQRSMTILQALHKDLFRLVRLGVTVEEAIRDRPEPDPLRGLRYACISWADHLQIACKLDQQGGLKDPSSLINLAVDFIREKFLFWLEALSLCQKLSIAAKVLVFLKNQLPSRPPLDSEDLVEDALRFCSSFNYIIERFPLQIYASGLVFSPEKSLIRGRFKYCTPNIFAKLPEVDKDWNVVQTRYNHPDLGYSVVTKFLQDSRQLLSISDTMNIAIWQVEDGSINKTAQIHDSIGARVRISSDLKWLVVVTSPSTSNFGNPGRHNLQVRDFSSNKVFFSKELTGGWMVQGIEISPNHQWLAVVYEGVLELYDLNLIKPEVGPIEPTLAVDYPETAKKVYMIAFSSDSTLIALGNTCAFDTQTGRWYHRYPPPGTIGWKVKFVPGTYTLAIITDDHDIYLWQVYEGMCERWGLPLPIFDVGFAHSDTWIAILGERYVHVYDFEKRTLITIVSIPLSHISKHIVVSRDDQTVVLNNWGEVLVLHMGALLTQIPPPTPTSIIHYCMSDDGGLISCSIGGKLEVWDTATGTRISELPLLPFGGTGVQLATFSPSGHDLAFTYNRPDDLHILVWNLSDNRLRNYGSPHSINKGLAVSDDGGKEGYWLAAASEYCVSLWGIATGEHKKLIDLTNDVSKKVSQIVFTGSRLGVLFQGFRDSQRCGWEFSLLNTRTGEQLYRVMRSRPDDCSYSDAVLRLSPNGTSGMLYEKYKHRLSVWDMEGNIGCVGISTINPAYFFRDEETLFTQQGHFSIHSVPSETTQSVVYGRDVRPGQNREAFLPSSTILEFKGYAYTNSTILSWIHLDNMLLLWVPAQYHPDAWTNVACGEDYVVVQAKAGVYSIRFKENARDFI